MRRHPRSRPARAVRRASAGSRQRRHGARARRHAASGGGVADRGPSRRGAGPRAARCGPGRRLGRSATVHADRAVLMRPRFALFTITNGVSACMMIAALSLLAVQAIGPLHSLVLAGAILWGRRRGNAPPRPLLWDALAILALVMFPIDLFVFSRSLIGAALRLLTFVVIYRCSNLTGRRELRQAVALSFVQILAAAASTTEAYFGPLLA